MKRKLKLLENLPFVPEVQKMIDNNTAYYTANNSEIIRLHNTDIFIKNGDNIIMHTGGWKTRTTKDRLNKALDRFHIPYQIYSEKGVWILRSSDNEITFYDGMKLKYDHNGKLINMDITNAPSKKELENLRKQVKQFSKEFIEKFSNGEIPPPSGLEDCWYCAFFQHESSQHILYHLHEKYYVPSLLYNSVFNNQMSSLSPVAKDYLRRKWQGAETPDYVEMVGKEQLEKNLYKFILRKLSMPV